MMLFGVITLFVRLICERWGVLGMLGIMAIIILLGGL